MVKFCPEVKVGFALLKVSPPLLLPTTTETAPHSELLPVWQTVTLALPLPAPLMYKLLPVTVATAAVGLVLPDK